MRLVARILSRASLILFGALVPLVLLEVTLQVAALIYQYSYQSAWEYDASRGGEIRIICLGESTTAYGGSYSYPSQLEKILNERHAKSSFTVINLGVPGTTSNDIIAALDTNIRRFKPHAIISMMGINDRESVEGAYERVVDRSFPLRSYKLLKPLLCGAGLSDILPIDCGEASRSKTEAPSLLSPTGATPAPPSIETARTQINQRNSKAAIEMLNTLIKQGSNEIEARLELGGLYTNLLDSKRAIEQYEAILKIDPSATSSRSAIANLKCGNGPVECIEALHFIEESLELKALAAEDRRQLKRTKGAVLGAMAARNIKAYPKLLAFYKALSSAYPTDLSILHEYWNHVQRSGDLDLAERLARKAVTMDKQILSRWYLAHTLLISDRNLPEAMEIFKAAFEESYLPNAAAENMATIFVRWKKPDLALKALFEGIEKVEKNGRPFSNEKRAYLASLHAALGRLYESQGELGKAEAEWLYIAETLWKSEWGAFANVVDFYARSGNSEKMELYKARMKHQQEMLLSANTDQPSLQRNLLHLRETASEQGIKLIVGSYPTLAVEPLRVLLGDDKITYVDNSQPFRDLVTENGFARYFDDNFAITFGHATDEGNRVLAQNFSKGVEIAFGLD